jgi:hypothetical protein
MAARRKAGDRRHFAPGRTPRCGTPLLAAQVTPEATTKALRLSVVRRSWSAGALRGNGDGGSSVRGLPCDPLTLAAAAQPDG